MLRVSLIVAMLCVPGLARAQEISAEQRAACRNDFEKYCSGVMPGGGRILACLSRETANLTDACRKALAAAEKK